MEYRFRGRCTSCALCLNVISSSRLVDYRLADTVQEWIALDDNLYLSELAALPLFSNNKYSRGINHCFCIMCQLVSCCFSCTASIAYHSGQSRYNLWTDTPSLDTCFVQARTSFFEEAEPWFHPYSQWSRPVLVSGKQACCLVLCSVPFSTRSAEGYVSLCPRHLPSLIMERKRRGVPFRVWGHYYNHLDHLLNTECCHLPVVICQLILQYVGNVVQNVLDYQAPVRVTMI